MSVGAFIDYVGRTAADAGSFLPPTVVKLPHDEDQDGVVAKLFGIPVGFQFGTAFGLTGVSGFAVDVLTDPLTWFNPFGALTKAGRAARAVGGARKGLRAAEASVDLGKVAEHVSQAAKAGRVTWPILRDDIARKAETTAKLQTGTWREIGEALLSGDEKAASKQLDRIRANRGSVQMSRPAAGETLSFPGFTGDVDRVKNILNAKGVGAAQEYVNIEIARRTGLRQKALDLAKAGNQKEFEATVKEIMKLEPQARFKPMFSNRRMGDLKALFDETRAGRATAPLADTVMAQAAAAADGVSAPQRALVTFRVPFTDIERPVYVGQGVMTALAPRVEALKKAAGFGRSFSGMVPGATKARAELDRLRKFKWSASADTVYQIGQTVNKAIAEDFALINQAAGAPGAVDAKNLLFSTTGKINHTAAIATTLGNETNLATRNLVPDAAKKGILQLDREAAAEGWKVAKYLDNPDKYVHAPYSSSKTGALTVEGKALGLTDAHIELGNALKANFQDVSDKLIQLGILDEALPNYMRRVVTVLKPKEFEAAVGRVQKSAQSANFKPAMHRSVESLERLEELEKLGVVKIEKNLGKIIQDYYAEAGRSVSNAQLMDQIGAARVPLEMSKKATAHLPLIMPGATKLKHGVVEAGHFKLVDSGNANSILNYVNSQPARFGMKRGFNQSLWVHEELLRPLRVILDPGTTALKRAPEGSLLFHEKLRLGLLMANSVMKRTLLFPGSFHFVSLAESAVSTMGADFLKNIPARVDFGQRSIHDAADVMDMLWKGGLTRGGLVDVDRDLIQRALSQVEKTIPGPIGKGARAFGRFTGVWDRLLWDYWQDSLKVYAAHELFYKGLSQFPHIPSGNIAKSVAEHVNIAFGGQMWENLLLSRKGLENLRLFFLAPDWTLGNLLVASDVFTNKFRKAEWFANSKIGKKMLSAPTSLLADDVRANFARRYALQTALIMGTVGGLANLAFSGHFMWDNEEGHQDQIELPWPDEKGKKLYLDLGKQYSEAFEAVLDPGRFIRNKRSTVMGAGLGLFTGKDGFGREIDSKGVFGVVEQVGTDSQGQPVLGARDGAFWQMASRAGYVINGALPIPVQTAIRGRLPPGAGAPRVPLWYVAPGLLGLPLRTGKESKQPSPEEVAKAEEQSVQQIPDWMREAFKDPQYKNRVMHMYERELRKNAVDALPVVSPDAQLTVAPQ